MPRDFVDISQPQITQIVADANIEMINGLIEKMKSNDSGRSRSKYKSSIELLKQERTRYLMEAEGYGLEFASGDVLRNSELSIPESTHETSVKEMVIPFLQGFFLGAPFVAAVTFAMCFFFAWLCGVSG